MCTLTYRLIEQGYELFFNRDEQKSRPQALQPTKNSTLNAIYPIDPMGGGTWIAVHESGLSLALLNYYQAQVEPTLHHFTSRGVIIPHLLAHHDDIQQQLMEMDLSVFQAFQLCVFHPTLSASSRHTVLATQYIWNGKKLTWSELSTIDSLPITSSAVDYEQVARHRKYLFNNMLTTTLGYTEDYIAYHQRQEKVGKRAVNMLREDAQTVSFTHIKIQQQAPFGQKINFNYIDYLAPSATHSVSLKL